MGLLNRGKNKHNFERDVLLVDNVSFELQEAYKTLRTNLQFLNADKNLKKLVITSCGPMEGKTTVSINLAISLAQADYQVLLIDGDLRKPRVHKLFDTFSSPGVTNILAQGLDFESSKRHDNAYKIDFLTSGPIPPNPAELLGSNKMTILLDAVSDMYDYIIIDTPPSLFITDAAVLSKQTDGVLVVCSSGDLTFDMMDKVLENLKNAGAKVIGTVLNNVNTKKDSRAYYRGKYSYYNYNNSDNIK